MARISKERIVLILLILGVAVRVAGFPAVPAGFNQDEAIVAYNAFTLLHEGVEPYGHPYPMNLLSWGQGSPVFGAVVMMPSLFLFGSTVFAIRLPYLLLGCLTLPLFYLFLRRIADRETAVLGLFLLAISPWHIGISRWALDANTFPFLLLAGCTLLLASRDRSVLWLYAAMMTFALSLYAYGPALVVVPVLLLFSLPFAVHLRKGKIVDVLGSLAVFGVLAIPMLLYVLINTHVLDWQTLHIGPLTIPKLEGVSRFVSQGFFSRTDVIGTMRANILIFVNVLWTQNDGNIYNVLPRFGIFYGVGTVFAAWGLGILMRRLWTSKESPFVILAAWLLGCLALSPMLVSNINRINAVPLLLIALAAIGLRQLLPHRLAFRAVIVYFLLWFISFVYAYFVTFAPALGTAFQSNLYGAIRDVVRNVPSGPICITAQANAPDTFAMLAGEIPSAGFRAAKRVTGSGSIPYTGKILALDRFTFGLERCDPQSQGYVVTQEEFSRFHHMNFRVRITHFDNFVTIAPTR